jgi:hypothetical protein
MCELSEVPWCESDSRQEGADQGGEGVGVEEHQCPQVEAEES